MLTKKYEHYFVYCDGDKCKAELNFAYVDRRSAEIEIRDGKWILTEEDKCYCPKCSDTLIRIIKQKQDEEYISLS